LEDEATGQPPWEKFRRKNRMARHISNTDDQVAGPAACEDGFTLLPSTRLMVD
jgi:hypothetical protein